MYLKFQMSAAKMGMMFRERIKRQSICISETFAGQNIMVDHITVQENSFQKKPGRLVPITLVDGSTTNINGNYLQFAQSLDVFLTTLDVLRGTPDSTFTQPVTITLVFNVTFEQTQVYNVLLEQIQSDLQLCLAYDHFDVEQKAQKNRVLAAFFVALHRDIDNALHAKLSPYCSSLLDLVKSVSGLGFTGDVVHAGIMGNLERIGNPPEEKEVSTRVEMRLEYGSIGSSALADWMNFYQEDIAIDTRLGSDDWSIFIDQEFLLASAEKSFNDVLPKVERFRLKIPPHAMWKGSGPPIIEVNFNGDAMGACNCFFDTIDVNVDVTATITLSTAYDDIKQTYCLKQYINLAYDPWKPAEACCAITSALLWPIVALPLWKQGWGGIGTYLQGLLGGAINDLVMAGELVTKPKIDPSTISTDCKQISDTETVCQTPITLGLGEPSTCGLPAIETFEVANPRGVADGLVLGGSITIPNLGHAVVNPVVHPFQWISPSVTCSGFEGQWCAQASVELQNTGEVWLYLCDVTVLNEKNNEFSPYLSIKHPYCPLTVIELNVPTYSENPCTLLIKTSGGACLVTIPAMPPGPTPDYLAAFNQMAEGWRLMHCYQEVDDWYRHFHRFNPKWLVDPPPGDVPVEHLWLVAVSGIRQGDVVELQDEHEQTISAGIARTTGWVSLSAFTAPTKTTEAEVSIVRRQGALQVGTPKEVAPQSDQASQQVKPHFDIKQLLLVQQATLFFPEQHSQVIAGYVQNIPALFVVSATGLRVYNIDIPYRPYLLSHLPILGLRGILPWERGFLAWGEQGLALLSPGKQQGITTIKTVDQVAVRDVVTDEQHVYILTRDGVRIYTRAFQPHDRVSIEDAHHIVREKNVLVVESKEGLVMFDTAQPKMPVRVGVHPVENITDLVTPVLAPSNTVFVREKQGGWLLEMVEPGIFQGCVRYEQTPWFIGAARLGNTLARLDESGNTLTIFSITGTRTL